MAMQQQAAMMRAMQAQRGGMMPPGMMPPGMMPPGMMPRQPAPSSNAKPTGPVGKQDGAEKQPRPTLLGNIFGSK
jgi:hypothetical protein